MAKLPLITVVAPESGPVKIAAVPKNGGVDPKVYFDTTTDTLVVEKLSAPSFTETVDGLVPAPTNSTGKYLKDDGTWGTPSGGGGGGIESVSAAVGSAITVNNTDPANPIIGLDESAILIDDTQVTGLGSLATKSSIDDTDVAANAAIDRSKLGTGTAGHVVINDPSTGVFSSEATLAPARGGTGLGAPVAGDAGKVLTAKADGTYELATKTVGTVTGVSAESGSPITVDNTNAATPIIGIDETAISITQSQVTDLTTDLSAKAATTYVDNQDAATLASANSYAEGLAYNISSKAPVHVTTTAALPSYTFSGNVLTASVDGPLADSYTDSHTLELNQRVLVKNETSTNEKYNGIYYLSQVGDGSSPWKLTRTDDANTAGEICGANVPVETGATNAGTLWLFSANSSTFVLNTDPVSWNGLSVTVPNATNSVAGKVQLAGAFWNDAANSYAAPSIDLSQTSYLKNTLSRALVAAGTAYRLIYNNSSGALTELSLGAEGQFLRATPTGPAWQSIALSDFGLQQPTYVLAGPTGGSPAAPVFRPIYPTDLPTIPATRGGTGLTSYSVGALLYANNTTTLSYLNAVATGNALISGGVGTAPSWGKIGLTTHVSGTLAPENGGTGLGAPAAGDAGKVLAATASGTYELVSGGAAGSTPYDIPFEYPGTPIASDVLMRFVSSRSFTLSTTETAMTAKTFPTGSNAVATLYRKRSGTTVTVGTITWTTAGAITFNTWSNTDIEKNDTLTLTLTTGDSNGVFEIPFGTIGGSF